MENKNDIIITTRNQVWGKVIFSQASVCPRGVGGVSQQAIGRTHAPRQTLSLDRPLPCRDSHWSGRYASYWNAFLLLLPAKLLYDVWLYILTVMEYIPRGELFAAWTACDCFGETLVRLYITEIAMVLGNNTTNHLEVRNTC